MSQRPRTVTSSCEYEEFFIFLASYNTDMNYVSCLMGFCHLLYWECLHFSLCLLSGEELHHAAGSPLLCHRSWGASCSRLPPSSFHFLLAPHCLLTAGTRAGGRGSKREGPGQTSQGSVEGWGALPSEGARVQTPHPACHLLLPGFQKLHGAGHQSPHAPPTHRQLEDPQKSVELQLSFFENLSIRREVTISVFPC